MNTGRKNFIPRNEGFICDQCGATVAPAAGTFRNHCPVCLASKHVDAQTPGDRAATCLGLMPAVGVEGTDPDALVIIHCCQLCGKMMRNRTTRDDDKKALFALMGQPLK